MIKQNDFACTCRKWCKRRCELVMQWAFKELQGDSKYPTTPSIFLTRAVVYLEREYEAYISDFIVDQWFAISASTVPVAKEQFSTFIQCDNLEDGLAFTLKAFSDHFKRKEKLNGL